MRLYLTLLSFFIFGNSYATNYYFSSLTGNDSRTSAEAQNPATPWRSIAKLNSFFSSLQPGDSILFKRGEVFEGSITVNKSGTVSLPIVLAAFGSGNKPILNGFASLSSWSFAGNGVYETHNVAFGNVLNMVNINDQPTPMGRYPNSNAINKGYLTFESRNTNLSLTDNELTSTTNWTGAEVVIRTAHWVIDRRTISAHTGSTIAFTPISTYWLKPGYGYFIQNDIRTLDQHGEWYFNPATKKLSVYFGSTNPSSYSVKASVIPTLISIRNQNNIVVSDLSFTGSNQYSIDLYNTQNTQIKSCEFSNSGVDAIAGNSVSNVTVQNNFFNYTNNSGIDFHYNCSNNIIRNNTIRNTTLFAGMLKSGNVTGLGIYVSGTSNLVEYNTIDSSGFTPIRFGGDYNVIKNNFLTNFNFVKDDEGGIYTWNHNYNSTLSVGRKVIGNIILNGIGAPEGTEGNPSADGIYMDDNSSGVEIKDNTIAHCNNSGIYIHDSHNISIHNNTSYNNGRTQVRFKYDEMAPLAPIRNMTMYTNIFFAKQPSQTAASFETIADDIALMGIFDWNYYCRPINDQASIFKSFVNSSGVNIRKSLDLDVWKPIYSKDPASRITSRQIPAQSVTGIIGSNKFGNESFNTSIAGVYAYTTATSHSTTWNSGGKLDGGAFQGHIASTTPCVYSPIINVGAVAATKKYLLKFSSLANHSAEFRVYLRQAYAPYATISDVKTFTIAGTRKENEFLFSFPVNESNASIGFETNDPNLTFWLDNLKLHEVTAVETNPDDSIRFEYNATQFPRTISLNKNYVDVKNVKYSSSLTLQPFTSIILLNDTSSTVTNPTPPVVSITNPLNNASFTAPANVTISANASDADGTISKVDFYAGNILLGTKTTAPYSFTWNNVNAGNYILTAKATDNSGLVTTSAAVSIVVNTVITSTPPVITITNPLNNASFDAPANVTISANASDADGTISKVDFYAGNNLLGTKTSAPYSFTWNNVNAGNYILTAKATDNSGLITTSAAVSIVVNTVITATPPVVSITNPLNNASFDAPANVTISANASDAEGSIAKVEFFNGSILLSTVTSSPYSFTWSNIAAGNYNITARATDNTGLVTTSGVISFVVNSVNTPITFAFIDFSGYASGNTIELSWITTNANNTKSFEIQRSANNGNYRALATINYTAVSGPEVSYQYTDVSPLTGVNRYRIKRTDLNNKTSFSTVINVNNAIVSNQLLSKGESLQTENYPEEEMEFLIKVGPIPAYNSITVYTSGIKANTEILLNIFSANGQLLQKRSVNSNNKTMMMDISKFPPGTYYLQVNSGDRKVTKAFTKQ